MLWDTTPAAVVAVFAMRSEFLRWEELVKHREFLQGSMHRSQCEQREVWVVLMLRLLLALGREALGWPGFSSHLCFHSSSGFPDLREAVYGSAVPWQHGQPHPKIQSIFTGCLWRELRMLSVLPASTLDPRGANILERSFLNC